MFRLSLLLGAVLWAGLCWSNQDSTPREDSSAVQLGPRPYYLIKQMSDSPLKARLAACAAEKTIFRRSNFSIGHRGAPLQFPEHTLESYRAAAAMGAGIIECDVTFTRDRQLVCRHSQCDLHTTTNIVATELATECSVPPVIDGEGKLTNARDIRCCTSDISLAQFKTLEGKRDGANFSANTIEDYLQGIPRHRTEPYSGTGRGTLMTHAESIELFQKLDVGMTPELKEPLLGMPFQGDYTQQDYARQMIAEYVAAGVSPRQVWPQSFNYEDVLFWLKQTPDFGQQAVFLEGRSRIDSDDPAAVAALKPSLAQIAADGVRIVAPPMNMLLTSANGEIVPSAYARAAQSAGLNIVAWTTERSGQLSRGGGGAYYQTVKDLIENDGDIFTVMHALAEGVGIVALFSDWAATTTFYANCISPGAPAWREEPPTNPGTNQP